MCLYVCNTFDELEKANCVSFLFCCDYYICYTQKHVFQIQREREEYEKTKQNHSNAEEHLSRSRLLTEVGMSLKMKKKKNYNNKTFIILGSIK